MRLTFGKRDAGFYGWYTAMAVFGCLYMAATIAHYEADTIAESALGLRIQTASAIGYIGSFCWFVFKLANNPFGKSVLILYSVVTFAAAAYALIPEYSFRYLDLDRTQVAKLPWGEEFEYRSGAANPLYNFYYWLVQFGVMLGMIYTFFMKKKEDRQLRIVLFVFGVSLVVAIVVGDMIGKSQIHFIYVDWVPAVWLFVAMSFYFSGAQLRLSKQLSHEIAERKDIEHQLKNSALIDDLTGLPNHQVLIPKLDELIRTGDSAGCYLLFIGIRDFKSINLSYGADNADLLLVELAKRLNSNYQGKVLAAREGGDCFSLIMEETPESDRTIEHELVDRQWSDLAGVGKPFTIGEQEVFLHYSIGIVQLHSDLESAQQAVLMAGLAMNEARATKRVVYYDRDRSNAASSIRAQEIDFAEVLSNQELSLYLQPQISAAGSLYGVEILTRWKHPTQGFVSPDTFIPIAERLGLINNLGWWVLRSTCVQLIEWDNQNIVVPGRVAINVSAIQLKDPRFARIFLRTIKYYNVDANRLEIEVTESATLGEAGNAKAQLEELSRAGVRVAIDDFGTGYSSLSYFNTLPISLLKIDRSFVRDMDSKNGARLVKTIVNMAVALDIHVLAEGVETDNQRQKLLSLGCEAFQGFLWGEAFPIEEFPEWMAELNAKPSSHLPVSDDILSTI